MIQLMLTKSGYFHYYHSINNGKIEMAPHIDNKKKSYGDQKQSKLYDSIAKYQTFSLFMAI